MGTAGSDVEAGFAKLQGEDFEYYMQTYSIILGRNSKKSTVDVDLSSLGGGMNISRHHARIFYDFTRRRFALEVLGKNGCLVEGVLHLPGNAPVKLDSQDLLQIGDKEFYFLLPVRNILGGSVGPRSYMGHPGSASAGPAVAGPVVPPHSHYNFHLSGSGGAATAGAMVKKGRGREYYEEGYEDEDDIGGGKKFRREGYGPGGSGGKAGFSGGLVSYLTREKKFANSFLPVRDYGFFKKNCFMDKKLDGRSRVDRETDNQLLQEEKDVVSSVANVLSDLCGPGEWMPMEKLHSELVEHYGNVWHHSRVRKYLTSEDWHGSEAKDKPWYGLLMLLRKYPEHFVINTRSKGRVTLEFVSLVSLLS